MKTMWLLQSHSHTENPWRWWCSSWSFTPPSKLSKTWILSKEERSNNGTLPSMLQEVSMCELKTHQCLFHMPLPLNAHLDWTAFVEHLPFQILLTAFVVCTTCLAVIRNWNIPLMVITMVFTTHHNPWFSTKENFKVTNFGI